ncbi:fatty acid hydroxylase superfamily protein [Nitzschia inconspicua]|uniref:Fatty acid hydroxylase superfamily protein n=1 Tax=Nitzschia inconspicua TaxID=303405 RepID=A0A9K3LFY7_9STRA|nr:fatty acid hydroxylase superfamily protein [Nitzschia inconspicua]
MAQLETTSYMPGEEIDAGTTVSEAVPMEKAAKLRNNPTTSTQNPFLEMTPLPWVSAVVWPSMLALPLAMTLEGSPLHYNKTFPEPWYSYDSSDPNNNSPKPLGLSLGLLAVAVGQLLCLCVFFFFKYGYLSYGIEPLSIQTKGARPYQFLEGLVTHLSQPEGFVLLGGYLAGTWMFSLMPTSYYSFEGGIEWHKVFLCLVIQDGIQYVMHLLEHSVSPTFYRYSHKSHHKFTNPRLFDAFNGSVLDTVCMILIPLYATANLVHCNVWSYMAFGSTYANWLTLIHSEYTFPWDGIFHSLGFGTPADHHVHHAFFKYNYGHLFMWFDMLGGTYKNPREFAPKAFNEGV